MASTEKNSDIPSVIFQSSHVNPDEKPGAMLGAGFGFEFAGRCDVRELDTDMTTLIMMLDIFSEGDSSLPLLPRVDG